MKDIDGIADLNVEQQVERPQLRIEPRREMLARYGVTLPQFARMVSVLLGGQVVSQVYEGEKSFDLTLKVADTDRMTAADIAAITVDANGTKVPLSTLANITSAMGPNTINRENVSRRIIISANVADRDLRGAVTDIQDAINANVDIPEGYYVEYGGQFESEEKATRTLAIASLVALIIVFLLLYNEFKNTTQSLIILINLPLAMIGGVLILFFTSGELNIPAIIGFISLLGVSTRNGMLLMSHYNTLRDEGKSLMERISIGSADRLSPIIMTALTSALALIPLALSGSKPGNEIQSPMAIVILGGLFSSTTLNVFVVPIFYYLAELRKAKKNPNNTQI